METPMSTYISNEKCFIFFTVAIHEAPPKQLFKHEQLLSLPPETSHVLEIGLTS